MSNFHLQELTGSILSEKNVFQEIMSLITNNVHLLRLQVIEKNTPMFDYYAYLEGEIIASTLCSRIDVNDNTKVYGTIVRNSIDGSIIAFALSYSVLDSNQKVTDNINLAKIVVNENYRNKGILGLILNHLKGKFKGITLTCTPDLVEVYEKAGFKVIDVFKSHLFMLYGQEEPEDASIVIIYDEVVENSPVGSKILKDVVTKYGKDAFLSSQKECSINTAQQEKKVKEIYSKYYA